MDFFKKLLGRKQDDHFFKVNGAPGGFQDDGIHHRGGPGENQTGSPGGFQGKSTHGAPEFTSPSNGFQGNGHHQKVSHLSSQQQGAPGGFVGSAVHGSPESDSELDSHYKGHSD
ncbi:hypothetical protein LJB42_000015 [Komagataella kurtzmanii]|nr:hypothetical protein LJB42_000015 [Komagataella kurtzmanii]